MSDRLTPKATQVIERDKKITFQYRGKSVAAYQGDTIASALYADGLREMASSFKYHRPRGIYDLGVHAAEPTMTVDGRYNTRIARVLAADGMRVEPQFKTGMDILKLADKASGALQVGFYYKSKTFTKSKKAWDKAREMMRSAPGNLGAVKPLQKSHEFELVNLTPEVLVVGGGAAGLEAALTAAKAGVRVVLIEAEPWLGGFARFQGEDVFREVSGLIEKTAEYDNLAVLTSTTAAAVYPDGLVVCARACAPEEPFLEINYQIRPYTTVIATGAMDRPLMFNHNDRPWVSLPQTAQRLIHLYGVKPAGTAVAAGGDDYIYQVALDLANAGCRVAGIVDSREPGAAGEMAKAATDKGIEVFAGYRVLEAKGKKRLDGVEIAAVQGGGGKTLKAESLFASCGRTPLFKLIAQTDASIAYDAGLNLHLPINLPAAYFTAGRLMGLTDLSAIKAQGRLAGSMALEKLGLKAGAEKAAAEGLLAEAAKPCVNPFQTPAAGDNSRRFICLGNDVTEKDIDTALEEGFVHTEMIKRYTTATMGSEQGSLSQVNFIDYLALKRPDVMGKRKIATPRPPLVGVSMGALAAGLHGQPRITPLHRAQMERGGKPLRTGPWIRIEDFGDPDGESKAVRTTAALCDVSTLGKFRLHGPDAKKLFNRVNTKKIDGLKPGRIRYIAACNEEGVVIDDGIAVKLGENDYYFTTATGRSPVTREWYLRWKRENGWKAWIADLSDALGGVNLAGPKSRDILAKLTDADISSEALPFMGWCKAQVAGVEVMIFRMGFLGELSFEIHCPSYQLVHVWESLAEAGQEFGLKLAGLETQLTCRLEKGHALPGMDTDGNTTLFEAHFGWLRDKDRFDMVGGPMLKHYQDKPMRTKVVPFSMAGRQPVGDGYIIASDDKPGRVGHITSVRYSQTLDQTIGLALIDPCTELEQGRELTIVGGTHTFKAQQAKTPFYDPEGGRMKI